jgi:hypothetical protein
VGRQLEVCHTMCVIAVRILFWELTPCSCVFWQIGTNVTEEVTSIFISSVICREVGGSRFLEGCSVFSPGHMALRVTGQ